MPRKVSSFLGILDKNLNTAIIKMWEKRRTAMIKDALIKKLEGDVALSETNLRTFLEKPIGVAEHIDYVETAEKELIKLADAKDKLEALKSL